MPIWLFEEQPEQGYKVSPEPIWGAKWAEHDQMSFGCQERGLEAGMKGQSPQHTYFAYKLPLGIFVPAVCKRSHKSTVDFSPAQAAEPCGDSWSNTPERNCSASSDHPSSKKQRGPLWLHQAPYVPWGWKPWSWLLSPCAQATTARWAGGERQQCLGTKCRPKWLQGVSSQMDTFVIWSSGDDPLFIWSVSFWAQVTLEPTNKRSLPRQPTSDLHIVCIGIFLSFEVPAWQDHLLPCAAWIRRDSWQLFPAGFLTAIPQATPSPLQKEEPSWIYWFLG